MLGTTGQRIRDGDQSMTIHIEDDFDLERIAESGQCFRWERLSAGRYRILNGASCVYAEEMGDRSFFFSCTASEFDAVWQDYFALEENYSAIRGRIDPEKDPFLWSAAEQEKGIRILRQDPWETLITFILSQNKNIPAIRRSIEALCALCGSRKKDHNGQDYFAFPDPTALASLSETELKACGLGYRWRYVLEAAKAVAEGRLDLNALQDAGEERTMKELTALFGVGVKVASCVSLFGLHHLNAFPQDVWIKRILKNEYPQEYPFHVYSPYNGVYQQYMFAYYRDRQRKVTG